MHGRTGGPFSRLLASRSPVPRDFYRSPTEAILNMRHLPHGKSWDASRIASVLSRNGVPASVDESTVRIKIPDTDSSSILGRLSRWLFGSQSNIVTIQHDPAHFIRNIDVHYDPLKISTDLPYLHDITVALRECGFVVKADRKIAESYCPDSDELRSLFDKIERLQREKEDFVAVQDFEAA